MVDNITVLNSTGGTFTIRMKDVGSGVLANMSLPTDLGGNTMVSSGATFTSTAQSASVVVVSSLSAPHTVVLSSNPTLAGTVTLSSNPTVIPSSAFQVTLTSNTVTLSSNPTVTSVTSGSIAIISGANTATVKAAATAATSADTALVVALSPNNINANGQNTMANSAPVTIASDQSVISVKLSSTAFGGATSSLSTPVVPSDQYGGYVAVAAGVTQGSLGSSAGRAGDYLSYVTVFPNSSNSGAVTIFDSTTTTVATYAGGGSVNLNQLIPFTIQIGAYSLSSGWRISTGSSVSILAVGKFT